MLLLLVVVAILVGTSPAHSFAEEADITVTSDVGEGVELGLLTDEQLEALVQTVVENLAPGANDADKVKSLFDIMAGQVVQVPDSAIAQEAIEALDRMDSSYECATAFHNIATRLGLECLVVKTDKDESYWNIVHVGDAWYHVDVWAAKSELNVSSDGTIQEATHAAWLLVGEQSLVSQSDARASWKLADEDWTHEDVTVSNDDYVWEHEDGDGQSPEDGQIEVMQNDSAEGETSEVQPLFAQALPNAIGGIQQVVAENENTAAVVNGALWIWGDNSNGQIGDGTNIDRSIPVKVMDDVAEAYIGGGNAGALKSDGSFWIWGSNSSGQLGDGTTTASNKPKKLMDGVRTASVGGAVVAIVKTDGSLWTLGAGTHGALGDGSTSNSATPKKIMDNVASVSMGGLYRGAAVKTDGTLWSWGWSYKGATLGNGSAEGTSFNQTTPVKIMDGVASVDLNLFGGVAVKKDGTLWAWGIDGSRAIAGQYRTGDNTPRLVLSDVRSASAANYSFAAIKTDNSLVTWGESNNGTLGNGKDDSYTYGVSTILNSVSMVDMGAYHGVALTLDGRVYTWGSGHEGQLGNGDPANTSVPAEITVVDNSYGSFTGKVCNAAGGAPVRNAEITARSDSGRTYTTKTDDEGNYTITVPGGMFYNVTIEASGYISFTYHAYLEKGENAYTEAFLLVAGSSSDQGVSKGTILNAKTSEPVGGVSLQFRKGWGVTTGAVVGETTSTSNGSYSIALPQGNYTMSMSKRGFVTSSSNVVSMAGDGFTQDAVLSPVGYDNEYRFVLTWGSSPSDLDSHIKGTLSNGNQFHVCFSHKSQGDGEATVCSLDVDDTSSYGPETTTLIPTTGKAYYYYIHQYSSGGSLPTSNAQVKVYRGSSLIRTFNVPTNQGGGRYWNVCAIVCGSLVEKDSVDGSANTEYAKDMEGILDKRSGTPIADYVNEWYDRYGAINYIKKDKNYLSSYIVQNNYRSSFSNDVIAALENCIFRGIEGWENQFAGTLKVEDAEKTLAGLLAQQYDETQVLETSVEIKDLAANLSEWFKMLFENELNSHDSQASKIVDFLSEEYLADCLRNGSFDELVENTAGVLHLSVDSLGIKKLKSFVTSTKFLNSLGIGLTIGGEVLRGYKAYEDGLSKYIQIKTMQRANEDFLSMLDYMASHGATSIVRKAAANLRSQAKASIDEQYDALAAYVLGDAANWLIEDGVSLTIDNLCPWYIIAGKCGYDLGVWLSNTLLKTSDSAEAREHLVNAVAISTTLSRWYGTVASDFTYAYVTSHSGMYEPDEIEERASKVLYAARVLFTSRIVSEEALRESIRIRLKVADSSPAGYLLWHGNLARQLDIVETTLQNLTTITKNVLFDSKTLRILSLSDLPEGSLADSVSLYVACPVTVRVVDGSGRTVSMIPDGETVAHTYDRETGVTISASKNDASGEYVKYVVMPRTAGYHIEMVGTGSGEVTCEALGQFAGTTDCQILSFNQLPIREGGKIVTSDLGASLSADYKCDIDGTGKSVQSGTFTITSSTSADSPQCSQGLVYSGEEQIGVTVGKGYTLSGIWQATMAGRYEAVATLDEGYEWEDGSTQPKTLSWSIAARTVEDAKVSGVKTRAYTGEKQVQSPMVVVDGRILTKGSDYMLSYKNNIKAGTATMNIKGMGNYVGSLSKTFKITKAANPMRIKAVTRKAKLATVKKKAVAVAAPLKFTKKAQGKVTYARVAKGSSKCLLVSKNTGKVTVRKGTKRGTYKVKIRVTAKGNANYKALSKVITCKVVVK